MKCHIFTPDGIKGFNEELQKKLDDAFEVVYYNDPKDVSKVVQDKENKVVALDPDLLDWAFSSDQIDTLGSVQAIVIPTTSYSWIDTTYARNKNIPVTNIPNYCTNSVAEYAIMMSLNLARKMPLVAQAGYQQNINSHQGIDLRRKRAGIIGLGHIGMRIAELCSGLDMYVTYYSQKSRNQKYEYLDLGDLFQSSDVIFLTLAKNEHTQKLITNDMLLSIKSDGMFISVVHDIYDHDLLIKRVQEGKMFGYGFEELNASPLDHKGNILSLPTLAWATRESVANNFRLWVEAMILAKDGKFPNQVN